ncbi:alpha/beta hydrolase [Dellaglioa sp. BT-FLS60]
MKNKRKMGQRLLIGLAVLACLLAIIIPANNWNRQKVKNSRIIHNSKLNPIILIPGSSASQNRFDELIDVLNTSTNRAHSLLKITVRKTGKLKITGEIAKRDRQPFIVVGFEDNSNGYSSIKKQAKWFNTAFNYLSKKYKFNQFNAIGHSNGGLIYTTFLEKYFDNKAASINTLMTIGSPYNGEETNQSTRTQMLADFVANRKKIPKDLVMYSIAGTENYVNDGIVPYQSVNAGKYVYQNQAKSYTEITVTGNESEHSDLPQNKQIVALIKQYVMDDSGSKNTDLDDKNK